MSRISFWRARFAVKESWRSGLHLAQAGARSAACCWPKVFFSAALARDSACGVRSQWLKCWLVQVAFLGSGTRSYRRFRSALGGRRTGHCRERFWLSSHVSPLTRPVHCTSRAAAFGQAAAKVASACSLSRKSAHHSSASRRECGRDYAARTAKDGDRYGLAPCPCRQCSRRILRQDTAASCRFLQGSHTSHRCASGRQ